MSFGARLARVALMAAVSAAVGAGTLPALLKQATPTEEAIARVALPAPPPPAPVAAAPLAVPMQLAAAPAAPPATEPAIVPPPAVTAPPAPPASSSAAGATPGPFPPVQPLTMDESVRPPAEQAAPRPDVPAAAASLPSRNAGKPAWRKRVASSRKARWRYARPRPFSIRQFLASLHLR